MEAGHLIDPEYLIKTFSYLGLLVIMFAETGLLMGFFLPGDSLLLTAGVFAARGDLDLLLVTALCFTGAVVGNTTGYWIGRKFGPAVFSRPSSRLLNPAYIEEANAYFLKFGVRTLIVSRFVPVIRTLVPTIAGAARMDFRTFMIYNVVGGAIWAVGVPVAGYVVGKAVPPEVLDKYILVIVGAVIVASFIPVGVEVMKRRARA